MFASNKQVLSCLKVCKSNLYNSSQSDKNGSVNGPNLDFPTLLNNPLIWILVTFFTFKQWSIGCTFSILLKYFQTYFWSIGCTALFIAFLCSLSTLQNWVKRNVFSKNTFSNLFKVFLKMFLKYWLHSISLLCSHRASSLNAGSKSR